MLDSNYVTTPAQGEITGTVYPDGPLFRQRKANARNTAISRSVFGGAEDDKNLFIMPHELLLGKRRRKDGFMQNSIRNEAVFSSFNGDNWEIYGSDEAMLRDVYFVGFAKGSFEEGGELLYGTLPLDHGVPCLRAGSYSTVNNGPDVIFAGDMVCYTVPSNARNVFPGVASGSPVTKALPVLRRFDPTNFVTSLRGIFATMVRSQTLVHGPGIAGMSEQDRMGLLYVGRLTTLQEEAILYRHALLAIMLRGYQFFKASEDGVSPQDARTAAVAAMRGMSDQNALQALSMLFLDHIPMGKSTSDYRNQALNDFGALRDVDKTYAQMVADPLSRLLQAKSSTLNAKYSTVIGKAMNTSKPNGGTMNLMVSHFVNGF